MRARTLSQQPQGERVGMADRLIHVPAGAIQRVHEGVRIETNRWLAAPAWPRPPGSIASSENFG